jgi:hypothetical protein
MWKEDEWSRNQLFFCFFCFCEELSVANASVQLDGEQWRWWLVLRRLQPNVSHMPMLGAGIFVQQSCWKLQRSEHLRRVVPTRLVAHPHYRHCGPCHWHRHLLLCPSLLLPHMLPEEADDGESHLLCVTP